MSELTNYDKFIQQALKYGFSLFGTAKTGAVISYEDNDDGDLKMGYPKTGVRFINNGDGTITDMASGLTWAQDAEGAGCFSGDTKTWAEALLWAEGLTFAGQSDWRIPNINELYSICIKDNAIGAPFIDRDFFTNSKSEFYWSSTAYPLFSSGGLGTNFESGLITTSARTNAKHIRAVRGGV